MADYKKKASAAGNCGPRDPSSHRTKCQIREMDRGYNSTPEMIRRRGLQNKARAIMMKEGLVRKGDNKDVDHIRMLDKGGGNARSNLRVQSQSENRDWRKDWKKK